MIIPRQAVGLTILALTLAYTYRRGSRPERIGVSLVAAGWLITPIVEQRESWYAPQFGIMGVDMMILAAFTVMTLRYNRFWTICAAGFQAIAVIVHFAFLMSPAALYRAYFFETFAIGYLVLGSILGGVLIESRAPIHRPPRSGRRSLSD